MVDVTKKVVVGKTVKYDRLLKQQKQTIFTGTRKLRNELAELEKAQITNLDKFLSEVGVVLNDPIFKTQRLEGVLDILQSSAPVNELRIAVTKLTRELDVIVELDHTSMEPVNVSLSLTIRAIESIIRDIETYGKQNRKSDDFVETYGDGSKFTEGSIADLRRVATNIRKLRIASQISTVQGGYVEADELKAGMEVYRRAGGKYSIEELKTKDLQGLKDGKVISTIEIKTKENHIKKSKFQNMIGRARIQVLGSKTEAEADVNKLLKEIKKIGPQNIEGSKTIKTVLTEQLADTLAGKKVKKYKSRTSKKTNYSVPLPKTTNKLKSKLSRISKQAQCIVAVSKLKAAGKRSESKRESGSLQKELNKLKSLINARLPAEVRRNMGRPALINRTGIFSNSVELLNLRDTGQTYTGEYTYMLTGGGTSKNRQGVYSTFENLGTKQWPLVYNPKPLISKSIRNLAQKELGKKFTLRRI